MSSSKFEPIIEFTNLSFHSKDLPHPLTLFKDEEADYNFGILNIKIRDGISINSNHIHMFFTIDASGSMSDLCSDDRTKMAHIHHTLENMLRIFSENKDSNISLHIQSFDNEPKTIISNLSNIHECNLEEIILSITQKIKPRGSTNIEKALEVASDEIIRYHAINPEHEIVHIFLTDGDITEGSQDYNYLSEMVPKNCTNIFIGYGLDHDSALLSKLSSEKGNEYRFIDH